MFREMNVIVGANNAGKSTLVEALRLLGLVASKYRGLTYKPPPFWTKLPYRKKGVMPAMGDIDLRGGSVFHRYGEPPAIIKGTFSNGCAIEVFVGPNNSTFGLIYDPAGHLVKSKAKARDVDIPRIATLPQIGPLQENEPVLSQDYVMRSIDTGLASRHFRNQMHYLRSEFFNDFTRRAQDSWHQLHIESLNIEGDRADESLSFHVRDTDFVAEISWMGHGLQMWLQTMWFLARSSDAATVILDEPDVYMHADLQRRLIRLLKKHKGQTIIATHSVEIMSEVGPEDILIVNKSQKKSSFAVSLPAVQKTIDQLGGVHNIHLARLWSARRCLHVEGDDVAFLKTFQDMLFPKSDVPFDVIPHLSIGGWSGWPQAIGATRSMKNSAGEDIVAYCVLDSDYHTEDDIKHRQEQASQHSINLHIWKRKEIENYLLIPSAISRLITEGTDDNSEGPSIEEVEKKIDEIAETLKTTVFDAMSQEYISNDRSGGVPQANQRARHRLDQNWQTREGKLGVVSGKRVISQLSKWSQSNFGVSFGPLTVAKAVKDCEMPDEVKDVVKTMENSVCFPSV